MTQNAQMDGKHNTGALLPYLTAGCLSESGHGSHLTNISQTSHAQATLTQQEQPKERARQDHKVKWIQTPAGPASKELPEQASPYMPKKHRAAAAMHPKTCCSHQDCHSPTCRQPLDSQPFADWDSPKQGCIQRTQTSVTEWHPGRTHVYTMLIKGQTLRDEINNLLTYTTAG